MQRTWQEDRALVFYDPNVRTGFGFSAEAERARVERQLAFAHVIKASKDDIALLYPGRSFREIAAAWQGTMSGLVAVTLGSAGVYALAPDGTEIYLPAAAAEVVDTVGAGDAFAAAILDRLAAKVAGVAAAGPDAAAAAAPDAAAPDAAAPDAAAAVRRISADVLRGLLERASVSAALTCERAGAQSPDARTLDAAMEEQPRRALEAQHQEIGLEPA
ncbi:MAG TPA: PfkB family carbohydrate kinase [Streptosporangiaceae bacterium]